jgi:hypothetical protein
MTQDVFQLKEYYFPLLEKYSLEALKVLEDLRNQVTVSQKYYTWYLYLSWRDFSEEEFFVLAMVLNQLAIEHLETIKKDEILYHVYLELVEQSKGVAKRFLLSRKAKNWANIVYYQKWVNPFFGIMAGLFLPITEFQGNYLHLVRNLVRQRYSLRRNTPRRLKKQERIRGYRDHGSASSPSERARRDANTSQISGITQEGYIVDYDLYQASLRQYDKKKSFET